MTKPTNPSITEMFDALGVPEDVRPAARAFGDQVIAATDQLTVAAAHTLNHMQRREHSEAIESGTRMTELLKSFDIHLLRSVAVQLAYAVVEASAELNTVRRTRRTRRTN